MARVKILLRVLMVVFALSRWVLPAMGVIDLTVTWDEEWPVVLEAGWGVLFTVGTGGAVLVAGVRPRSARPALVQLTVVTLALAVAAALGHEPETWWIFVMLAIQLPLVRLLAGTPAAGRMPRNPALLALAALAAIPAVGYAWWCLDQNRQSLPHGDITNDVDHFAVQGALGLVLVALPLVAGVRTEGRRLLGTSAALMAAYLGLVSLAWPGALAGFSAVWSVATMVWAAAVLGAAWSPLRAVTTVTDPGDLVGADA
jgi:hypothetical protein